ncbi:hypothetical protein ACLM5J_03255 [Nocardioides sp. Bht2]|uniref:hypothetical protein n=1 Tax=Nocardioides sp. Bht2 TaxID=3392297 RepID=UPI0039B3BA72
MKSTAKTSVQQMSNGTWRVGSAVSRSAITGRFVTSSSRKPSAPTKSTTEASKK